MTRAILMSGVSVVRGGHTVLTGVDLEVPTGAFVAVIGPNGGGKTTLLRTLLGLVGASAGKVEVLGAAPRPGRGSIGYVPQDVAVDGELPVTAGEVIRMGLIWRGRTERRAAAARVAEVVEKLELGPLLDRRYGALSGGEKRRTLIARALVLDPDLLLLDEPTAGVDPGHIEPIYDLLAERPDRTVLIVTHDLSVVSTHVDRIACVNGSLVMHASNQVDAHMLRELYGAGVEPLLHGPVRLLADHDDGHGHAHFHAAHHHAHGHHAHGHHAHGAAAAAARTRHEHPARALVSRSAGRRHGDRRAGGGDRGGGAGRAPRVPRRGSPTRPTAGSVSPTRSACRRSGARSPLPPGARSRFARSRIVSVNGPIR